MLRLSSSQVLLTNRDVSRTLNPKRIRRPPTYLYTKGKQPLRSTSHSTSSSTIPHINTSRPSTSSRSPIFSGRRARVPPSSDPLQPSSPDWSASSSSSDTESLSSLSSNINMSQQQQQQQQQSNVVPSTDGPGDETMAALLRDMGPLQQVVSLETIDSFPFVPYRLPPSMLFQIYEDPVPPMIGPVGGIQTFEPYTFWDSQPFPYLGGSYGQVMHIEDINEDAQIFENDDDDGWNGDGQETNDEGGENELVQHVEESIILNETMWDPDTMIIVDPEIHSPVQDNGAPRVAAGLLESPPR
ncbi:hypothetical protein TWF730_010832 [Orbilia blumenaviensis]|uniref:Uncharacterized protein n=1 Tax=Orbilia blumenaviensis TaxID=1796055 RepID=A0AAV9UN51_9PEZI